LSNAGYVRTISSRRRTPGDPPTVAAMAPSSKDTKGISDALDRPRRAETGAALLRFQM